VTCNSETRGFAVVDMQSGIASLNGLGSLSDYSHVTSSAMPVESVVDLTAMEVSK